MSDTFEQAYAAMLDGEEAAFQMLLGAVVGPDADDRDEAAQTLAELVIVEVLDDEQLRIVEGTIFNIRKEWRTPGVRYLIEKLSAALEADDDAAPPDRLDRADYAYERWRDDR